MQDTLPPEKKKEKKNVVVNSQSPPHKFSQDVLKLPPGVPHQTLNLFNKFYSALSQMLRFVVDTGVRRFRQRKTEE